MDYYATIFSPETRDAFLERDRSEVGFSERTRRPERLRRDDILICYLTKVSRWYGLLEVVDGQTHRDESHSPYSIRLRVRPLVLLERMEHAIPIHDREIWDGLSFTRELPANSNRWTGKFRRDLSPIEDEDGAFLSEALRRQAADPRDYPLNDDDRRKLSRPSLSMRRADADVPVSVPEPEAEQGIGTERDGSEVRTSHQVQATLARLGDDLRLRVWIPRNDRERVQAALDHGDIQFLDRLPLNYDEATLRTIENIDVLWLRGRSIVRAFEVEHTTAIYSGILRMADLLALQPNMDIKLHIVAPSERRDKVFEELRRPVFAQFDRGPLAEQCTYISYESLDELSALPNLRHTRDSVIDDYAEEAVEI